MSEPLSRTPVISSRPGWWANLARRRAHYAQLNEQAKRWGAEVIELREENERLRMQASRRDAEIRGLREMLNAR